MTQECYVNLDAPDGRVLYLGNGVHPERLGFENRGFKQYVVLTKEATESLTDDERSVLLSHKLISLEDGCLRVDGPFRVVETPWLMTIHLP